MEDSAAQNETKARSRTPKNAKWSDGSPVTAHDFVYAWERLANPNTASPYAYYIGLANVIDLYCEFVTGTGQEKDEIQNYSITEYTVGDRYDRFIRGIKVKIDTSKKKIIDSPQDFNPDDGSM